MEECSLQEKLRNKEFSRSGERDRGLDKSGNGRRFQTSEGRLEKGFDEWIDMGSGCWQRMDLERILGDSLTSDPLEKNATRNTARPWWVALEMMKELEDCLKKLDHEVSCKRRNWATQQKAEVNKLELGSQLKRTWQSLLRDYFEEAMRTPSSALSLMANPFVRTAGQLMFV